MAEKSSGMGYLGPSECLTGRRQERYLYDAPEEFKELYRKIMGSKEYSTEIEKNLDRMYQLLKKVDAPPEVEGGMELWYKIASGRVCDLLESKRKKNQKSA